MASESVSQRLREAPTERSEGGEERAWLAGREAARANRGPEFDLAEWHAKALSLGALGLADLADELSGL